MMAASDTRQEGTVYMRITRGKVDPSRYAEVKGLGRELAVAISRLPGAQDYHGGGDAATGPVHRRRLDEAALAPLTSAGADGMTPEQLAARMPGAMQRRLAGSTRARTR